MSMRFSLLILISLGLSSCGHLFYFPDKRLYLKPSQLNLDYQDQFFPTEKGHQLHAWKITKQGSNQENKGTIVFFHGNAQNLSAHFLQLHWIVPKGYRLFIFDYSGYGKSGGVASQDQLVEDGLAALDQSLNWHQATTTNSEEKFIVYGQSLGGAVAFSSLAQWKKRTEVDLAIIDSSFTSFKGAAFDALKRTWLTFLISPLAYILVSDRHAPENYWKENQDLSFLLIHSKEDQTVDFRHALLFQKNLKHSTLWALPEGAHIGHFGRKDNQAKLLKYLDGIFND